MKLVTKLIPQATVAVEVPTHRIVVIDCSGSMYGSLSKIRTELKNKIPTMVLPNDRLSIVWFSGRDECGVLLEAVHISTLKDLSKVNSSIDRFLQPVGCTAFTKPLQEVAQLINRVGMSSTMFFMTDGCSNEDRSRKDILTAAHQLASIVDAATFVEYGWYADHELLTELSEVVGASLIQSTDFDSYVQQMETNIGGSVGGKKIIVNVESGVDYVVAPVASGFIVAKVTDNTAAIPASCASYTYAIDDTTNTYQDPQHCLLYMASLVQRGKVDVAIQLAEVVGDVDVYQMLQNAFSKQDYVNVVESLIEYAKGAKMLYSTAPKSKNLKVDDDAYNVLQMLIDVSSSEGNYLHLSHPSFKYSSIGAKQELVPDANGFIPTFESKDADIKAEITTLKFDEDRPNVSILVRRDGYVDLPQTSLLAKTRFDTYVWRNYTIIKDGIINTQYLPLILTAKMHKTLSEKGVITEDFVAGKTYVIDTKKLPVINRKMVQSVSAKTLASYALDAYKLRCVQKVLNSKIKEEGLKVSKFVDMYGQEATDFLKEYGITEGGFSPKKVTVPGKDGYMSKELQIKMKGLSSIPKIEDVEKAHASKKALTPSLSFLSEAIRVVDGIDDLVVAKTAYKDQLQQVMSQMVKIKFSVILGKKWFSEFSSMDENTITVSKDGRDVDCSFVLSEKEIMQ